MLKVTRLSSAGRSADYYGKDDYYVSGEADAPGLVWRGEGAQALGLEPGSEVDPDTFRSLLEGINPDPDGPAASRLDQLQRERSDGPAGDGETCEVTAERERPAGDVLDRQGEDVALAAEASSPGIGHNSGDLEQDIGSAPGERPATEIEQGKTGSKRAEHAPGFDLTFNAPKSVSLLSIIGGDERLDVAHREAIGEAMAYVQAHLGIYRARDEDGAVRSHIGKGLVWAETEHGITRAGDPGRHTHVVLMNMVLTEEGGFRAFESRELFKHMHLVGSIYLTALRDRVHEAGYITRDGKGGEGNFEIVGFEQAQLKAFSKRTDQIQGHIDREEAEAGRELTGQERQLMRKLERPFKPEEPRAVLQGRWHEEAKGVALDLDRIRDEALARGIGHHLEKRFEGRASPVYSGLLKFVNPHDMPHETAKGAVAQGLAHAEERAAVFTRHEVLASAMEAADYRFSLDAYEKAYSALLKKGDVLPADKTVVGGITTARAVAMEREAVDRMQAEKGNVTPFARLDVDALLTRSGFERMGNEHIPSDSQARVIDDVLRSRDGVLAVTGPAGAGKTQTFAVIAKSIEDLSGGQEKLLALAPTHKAITALRDRANVGADTVSHFLGAYAEGKERGNLDQLRATYSGHRLLVDEASMLSNPQMCELLSAKADLGIKQLILSGDERQLPSVQAGAPLKLLLSAEVANPKFSEIRRQKDETLKDAIYALSRGEPSKALPVMGEYIKETGSSDDPSLVKAAVAEWKLLRNQGKDAVVVVPTNAMREEVTAQIRGQLIDEGKVSAKGQVFEVQRGVSLTKAELGNSHSYSLGQTLSVFKGDKASGTKAGDRILIDGIDHQNNRILGRGAGGKSFELHLSELAERGKLSIGVSTPHDIMVAAGDRMMWTSNDKKRGITNGDGFEVVSMGQRSVTVRDERGQEHVLSRSDPLLKSMAHSYAMTADKAQGQTFGHVVSVLSSRLGEFANNARAYVMASRPSDTLTLITDNTKALFRKLGESDGINRVALEHIDETYARAMSGDFVNRDQVRERDRAAELAREAEAQKAKALPGADGERDAAPAMGLGEGKKPAAKETALPAASAKDDAWNKKEKELIMPPFNPAALGRNRERERGM